MDFGWRFHLGSASSAGKDFGYSPGWTFAKAGEAEGPMNKNFNDSSWRLVDIPHDWAVELPFVKDSLWTVESHGFKPLGRHYPETSIGWYRKQFTIPEREKGKRLALHFDGVFRDCIVAVNGHFIGRNLSGYSEFNYDITDYINYGSTNVVVVRVDATFNEGWFYEGAGIYRHVWLIKHSPLHIPEYGTYVWSDVKSSVADINVETTVRNQFDSSAIYSIGLTILDKRRKPVASISSQPISLESYKQIATKQQIVMDNPNLWSIENPYLYTLITEIKSAGSVLDKTETLFGIRTVHFDKDKGFFLNGKHVKIKGVCCHQDHAGVGSALPDRLQYYRIEKLKEIGVNAYRTSHNPPTKELLDACDRLGMLVLDENRMLSSAPEYMSQFERLILRDRNHPSVFLWCIGNEEWFVHGSEPAKQIAFSLIRKQKELDPSRMLTYGGNNGNQFEGINSVMPVRGFNYINNTQDMDKYHREHPQQPLIGTEEASTVATRGIYVTDSTRGYLSDYDIHAPPWGSTAEYWWKFYSAREWLAGGFVWTGFDYRGEPTPFRWPCISTHFGILDMCGFPKNQAFYYKAWWTDDDVLHLFPHWNWDGREGDTINVWCQTNCDTVEIFLNERSFGRKIVEQNSHVEWKVPYSPGKLKAFGIRKGKRIFAAVQTTGEPYGVVLAPDRSTINADGEDVCVVNVTVIDKENREVATAGNEINFELTGGGKIIGVGNGNPGSHEQDQCLDGKWKRQLFNGKCQVIVKASRRQGEFRLTASSQGLQSAMAKIRMQPSPVRPFVAQEK